ncbi:alpha/beta-hydrolase [Aspergillus steynii IBT 23096]|uniref:Carboxylic ester hydrolase n=1 Tax=Aspergillus steynii IBT 23096 TaxID=1392250 RepID=A0A2I2G938_9EURO|nr:alpha/beta-hydrolase [Aspergillus steynii IBT 23096]PLB49353.1 alpha/beta-hydrolase [Aspergillus steynii IBT 23096]
MPNACMQTTTIGDDIYGTLTGGQYLISTPVSEDCLTLSIWAPAKRRERLPVVIFIHGGGLSAGGESVQYQIPANWVERSQSHIVVSIQYRLGVFGFPGSHALKDKSQNFGLLDQRLAIEWVRDNIAAFGGNPDQITLWGQSAGAASIDWYNFAYPNDPIAKGFIIDSGSVWLFGGQGNASQSGFATLASHFNCTGSDAVQLACLRNQPATKIEAFIEGPSGSALSFQPVQDNITVFSDYTALYQQGHFADVPAIYGANLNEPASTFLCPEVQGLRHRLQANKPRGM